MEKKKVIITYGTFDMYHEGHRNVIKNSKEDGSFLIVGVASDEYVNLKGKKSLLSQDMRFKLIESDPLVDKIIIENSIDQWPDDYSTYEISKIRISEEHECEIRNNGMINDLNVEYFPRTPNISSTSIKEILSNKKVVITYGTFDLLHEGHVNIFKKAKELGDILIVAVSTDEFNVIKGKSAYQDFSERINNVRNNKFVDYVIPEITWDQKIRDIGKLKVDIFVMGDDWKNKFNELKNTGVEIRSIKRTEGISSTLIRKNIIKDK